VPKVLQVISALRLHANFAQAIMAKEFLSENDAGTRAEFESVLQGIPLTYEPHNDFKKRIPGAVGLIRTGDTIQYANTILISG
jgi:D-ribose pyranase